MNTTNDDSDGGSANNISSAKDDLTGSVQPDSAAGQSPQAPNGEPVGIEQQIIESIQTVFDPEIPVNIYELGLIYDVDVQPSGNVQIKMTLTSPACPSAQEIPLEVRRAAGRVNGVKDVEVDVVFDPPWSPDKMSDAAKVQLGMM